MRTEDNFIHEQKPLQRRKSERKKNLGDERNGSTKDEKEAADPKVNC